MNYQEAIEILKKNKPTSDPRRCGKELCTACDVAISAMQELQEWHMLGTLEEIRESMKELSLHQYCGEYHCDVCALEERNAKLREYERILALEEVRGAMEKQKAKKPIIEYEQTHDCVTEIEWKCPTCEENYIELAPCGEWCRYCGTKLDWSMAWDENDYIQG